MIPLNRAHRRFRSGFLASFCLFFLFGCDSERPSSATASPVDAPLPLKPKPEAPKTEPVKTQPPSAAAYSIPERTSEEVTTDLRAICERAHAEDKRILVEFSAEWCGDCRKLALIKQEPVLKETLEKVPHYVVNVGRFDRHEALLTDFGIRSIANWQVLDASECSTPVAAWKRVSHRTLEPRTGQAVTAEELSSWLSKVAL